MTCFEQLISRLLWKYTDDDAQLIDKEDPRRFVARPSTCPPNLAALFYYRSFEALTLLHQPKKARHPRFIDAFPEVLPFRGFLLFPAVHKWHDETKDNYLLHSGMCLVDGKSEFRLLPEQSCAFIAHTAPFYEPLIERQLQRLQPSAERLPWDHRHSFWSDYQCATKLEYTRHYAQQKKQPSPSGGDSSALSLTSHMASTILIDIAAQEFDVVPKKLHSDPRPTLTKEHAVALCVLYYRATAHTKYQRGPELTVGSAWDIQYNARAWFGALYYAPKKWFFVPRKGGALLRWWNQTANAQQQIDALFTSLERLKNLPM